MAELSQQSDMDVPREENKEVAETREEEVTRDKESSAEAKTQEEDSKIDDTRAEEDSDSDSKDDGDKKEADGQNGTQRAPSEEGEIETPPLPPGPPPDEPNDGWQAIWEPTANAYYFYNSFTGVTTWENPRVPQDTTGTSLNQDASTSSQATAYNVGIAAQVDGNYIMQPPAPGTEADGESSLTFYQLQHGITDASKVTAEDIADSYASSARFNRFTGKFQNNKAPEDYSDEAKAKRQMSFYFDVDAAANSHDGKSLRAERQQKKLTKKEVKAFKEKRREKKEQKRRAWLKD